MLIISNTNEFSFNLDKLDHAIVASLQTALEHVMPEIMAEHNLIERNGYGQFRWNAIIAQLRDMCQHLGWLDMGTCPRGAWKTPVLFHAASRNIFTFMTEDTFRTVQRRKDKEKHYLCGGAWFNHSLQPQYEQLELDLPKVSSGASPWIAQSQEQLAKSVYADVGEICGHILVLFEVRADRLLTVRAIRLTHNLEVSTEAEDWSRYISLPYSARQVVTPQQTLDDSDEDLVELL